MKKLGTVALALVLGFILTSSCAKKREVTVDLLDACAGSGDAGFSFRKAADYVEFAVFPNACPTDDTLAAGDTSGARFTATVPADSALPDVGDLPKSKFGFAVILRDATCTVIGYGCTEADLDSISGVRIAACDWQDKTTDPNEAKCLCTPLKGGGCPPPTQCQKGVCRNGGTGDGGACSLVVTKAGKLPDVPSGAHVTGPSIVSTEDGFVYGYRIQAGAVLTGAIGFISDGGVATPAAPTDLGGCASPSPLADGVGLAYADGAGLYTTSLMNCSGAGAGSVFIPFDSKGVSANGAAPRSSAFNALKVAQADAIAPASTKGEYEFCYRIETLNPPVVERVVLQGPAFKTTPSHLFDDEDIPYEMVATSKQVRAFLAPQDSLTATVILVDSPGSDTFTEKGQFQLPLSKDWAAMTAWDTRVAAAVPASTGMTMSVAELSGTSTGDGGAMSVLANALVGKGIVAGGALATLGSHLLVVQGKAGGITVIRFEDAKQKIDLSANAPSVDLPQALGPVNLSTFDGVHIAAAAVRNNLAVVWLSKGTPGAGDPTGGWALLHCSN